MAIVIAGIIGGVIAGVIVKEHSDYGDYSDHSDYSDYARQRRKAEKEARRRQAEEAKRRREEARAKLDGIIASKVRSFENREGVTVETKASRATCSFEDFETDMKPMDASAKKAIREQVAVELKETLTQEKARLKELDGLIQAVNERILAQGPKKKTTK